MRMQNGIFEENEMVSCLNNTKYGDLNNNLKIIVKQMFGYIGSEQTIYAKKLMAL